MKIEKAGQGISPLPGRFLVASCEQVGLKTHAKHTQNARKLSLNHAKNFEHKHDNTHSIKPNLI